MNVGIVTCNNDQPLGGLLSLLTGQVKAADILVADGANSPETRRICEAYQVQYIDTPSNDLGANRTEIANRAESDWIFFIDTDCSPDRDWYQKMLENCKNCRGDGVDAFGGAQVMVDNKGRPIFTMMQSGWWSLGSPQFERRNGADIDHVPTFNSGFERKALLEAGGFPSSPFNVGEDLALGWIFLRQGRKMRKFSEPVVRHRQQGSFIRRMYGYGRAQVLAARIAGWPVPARFYFSASAWPMLIGAAYLFPTELIQVLVALLLLTLMRGAAGDWARLFLGYIVYSGGMWREWIFAKKKPGNPRAQISIEGHN